MACVEGGRFVNGAEPRAARDVATFWLELTEVTVAAYAACVSAGACTTPTIGTDCNWGVTGRDEHPVNCVDWDQAAAYCEWAGKRLPGEWEWEWATRGRDEGRTFPWGGEPPTCARAVMYDVVVGGVGCNANSTAPAGSKPAGTSRDGLVDLAGNVFEWTSDWYDSGQTTRVLRGGSWQVSTPLYLRAYDRLPDVPSARNFNYGFRCAQTP
jgi:formylglycine-generating enzyme required for sulfatase activity